MTRCLTFAVLALALYGTLPGCGTPAPTPPGTAHAARSAAVEDAGPEAARWTAESRVGTIVAERPEAARIFELVQIDYCCGGTQRLMEACEKRGLDVQRVLGALHAIGPQSDHGRSRSWARMPLEDLMAHIERTHHARLRRELPRLGDIVATVVRVHGDAHPELDELGQRFRALREAIPQHLQLEEDELFPALRTLAGGKAAASRRLLEAMRTDHDEVGETLHRIRALTKDYAVPEDACALYQQMLSGLAELERDLHEHVHLENNVLLPRAMATLEGS